MLCGMHVYVYAFILSSFPLPPLSVFEWYGVCLFKGRSINVPSFPSIPVYIHIPTSVYTAFASEREDERKETASSKNFYYNTSHSLLVFVRHEQTNQLTAGLQDYPSSHQKLFPGGLVIVGRTVVSARPLLFNPLSYMSPTQPTGKPACTRASPNNTEYDQSDKQPHRTEMKEKRESNTPHINPIKKKMNPS